MFTCPICTRIGVRSNSVEVQRLDRPPVLVCWSCAQSVALAVERAYQEQEEKDREPFG